MVWDSGLDPISIKAMWSLGPNTGLDLEGQLDRLACKPSSVYIMENVTVPSIDKAKGSGSPILTPLISSRERV